MKHLILFTMKSCPHCSDFKNMLTENGIDFHDHDIDEHREEYDMFTKLTESEFVPAFMIIDENNDQMNAGCFAPDRDYQSLEEAVEIIKKEII